MKLIAVNGFSYQISNPIVQATVTMTGTPSTKNKVNSKGVCLDQFGVTVTNITAPTAGATIPDPGPYNLKFAKTSTKCKDLSAGKYVLRVDDETDTCNATPKIPGSPNPVDFPVSFHLTIIDANQTNSKGN